MRASCSTCGFDASSVSPPDAVVALRSFPRRFRALMGPPPDDDGPVSAASVEAAKRRQAAARTEAGVAAEAIAALGEDLRHVLIEDKPSLPTDEGEATNTRHSGDPVTALDRLTAATTNVANLAAGQPGDSWTRSGTRSSGAISAADLLREAVHAGAHHLRVAMDAG